MITFKTLIIFLSDNYTAKYLSMKYRFLFLNHFAFFLLSLVTPSFSQIYEGTVGLPTLPGQFKSPTAITVDPSGNVFVADDATNLITKFDANGAFLLQWGGSGSADGKFNVPLGLDTDAAGNVYVTEGNNNRVQKFDGNGNFLLKFGGYGTTDGLFEGPSGIAIDAVGNIFVSSSNKIQKFSSSGAFLSKFGSFGSGDGQFKYPGAMTIDAIGNIYVSDRQNYRVQKFDNAGTFLSKFGTQGGNDGQFSEPQGIAFDPGGNIYVADGWNNRFQKFSSTGAFLAKVGTYGSGNSLFRSCEALALDALGNIYVGSREESQIQKFNPSGTFLTKWGKPEGEGQFCKPQASATDSNGNIYVVDTSNNRIQKFNSIGTSVLKQWGNYGSGNSQFNYPGDIAIDVNNNVYVLDRSNNRIQKFDVNGVFILKFGLGYGSSDSQFKEPSGIATDASGNVYVSDLENHRIQKFSSTGTFLSKFGTLGSGDGQFNRPNGVAIDGGGNIYVADGNNFRIQKFSSDGTFISKWGNQNSSQGFIGDVRAIAINASGNILVCDWNNVYFFDSNGVFLSSWNNWTNPNDFFYDLSSVSVGTDNIIYVSDTRYNRIVKFSLFSISSFSAPSGLPNSAVTINGSGFSTIAAENIVKFGSTVSSSVTPINSTSLTAIVPPAQATTGPVTITRNGLTTTSPNVFIVLPFVISNFTPNIGSTGTEVTIIGSGFSSFNANNIVKFNGINANPTFSSYTSLKVPVPAGNTIGKITVTVAGQTVTSDQDFIGTLSINSLSANSGVVNSSVTLTGTGFSSTPADQIVKFNGVTAEIVSSTPTSINVKVPPSATTGSITVTRSTATAISLTEFLVLPLSITTFSPDYGSASGVVTITGTGFSSIPVNNIVKFNGIVATVQSPSTSTTLKAVVPGGNVIGKISVTIGSETAPSLADFGGPLSVTSFTPASGATNSTVTISGTGFSMTASNQIVKFNNIVATTTPISTTSLSAVVPAGATTGSITVGREGTIVTSPKEFVALPFKINSFSPVTAGVNTTVTIVGSGFSSTVAKNIVLINGEKAEVTYRKPDTLKITIPLTATRGKIKITVENETITSDEDLKITNITTTVNFPQYFIIGSTSIEASVTINSIAEVQSIKFLSKGISSKDNIYKPEDVPVSGTSNVIAFPILAARFSDPIGLHYYFSITDKNGNTDIRSSEGYTYLKYPATISNQVIPNLLFGKTTGSYQLTSVPLNLTKPKVLDVFGELVTAKKNKMRLYSFNGQSQELDGSSSIELGKGYWLIVKEKTDINPGEGTTPNVTEKNPYKLSLISGWNLIGNPYNFTISWKDVLAANSNPTGVGNLKLYKAGFVEADLLPAYGAAFVRLDGADKLDLKIPVVNKGITSRIKDESDILMQSIDSKDWQVRLMLDDGFLRDELGGIGMNSEANEGKDLFDEVTLPVPEGLNNFELILKELPRMKLLKDIVPTNEEHTWNGQLWSEHDVTISWDNSYFGNNDKQLVLETSERVELIDMKKASSLRLSSGKQQFKIHFGSTDYIKAATLGKEARAGDIFPNPLAKGESLKINLSLPSGTNNIQMQMKDLSGKNALSSGVAKYNEGRQLIEWIGDFSQLTSGLYVVKISVSHSQGISTFYKKIVIE